VRLVEVLLKNGMEPVQLWQLVCTSGNFSLMSNAVLTAPPPGQKLEEAPQSYRAYEQTQGALERLIAGDPDAPISAISFHDKPGGGGNAARAAICKPSWFFDPSSAVVVAADSEDLDACMAQLRKPIAGQDSNEDPLASAQWVAEELMAPFPGWRYSGPAPVLLADQVRTGDSWREVFLSPGCRGLRADQLLPVVGAAQVGLHIAKGIFS
jgi:hypothetical protein